MKGKWKIEVSGFLVNYLHINITERKMGGKVENSTKIRIGFKKTLWSYGPTHVHDDT